MPLPEFDFSGLLPEGIHEAEWEEFRSRYGYTPHRRRLLKGLNAALQSLARAGCRRAYIDGSFITTKERPGDFDACWEEAGVDVDALDPILLDFTNGRANQKAKFRGELFPASVTADGRAAFLTFFQTDKSSGKRKGIVCIDLTRWQS